MRTTVFCIRAINEERGVVAMTRYNIESTLKLIVAICFFALFLMADTATDKLDAVMGMTVFSFLWGPLR